MKTLTDLTRDIYARKIDNSKEPIFLSFEEWENCYEQFLKAYGYPFSSLNGDFIYRGISIRVNQENDNAKRN